MYIIANITAYFVHTWVTIVAFLAANTAFVAYNGAVLLIVVVVVVGFEIFKQKRASRED